MAAAVDPSVEPLLVPDYALKASPHPLFLTESIPAAAPGKAWVLLMWWSAEEWQQRAGEAFLELPLDLELPELLVLIRGSSSGDPHPLSSCGLWVAGRRMKASGDTLRSLGAVDGQTILMCTFGYRSLQALPSSEGRAIEDATQEMSQLSIEEEAESSEPLSSEDLRGMDDEGLAAVYGYLLPDPDRLPRQPRAVGSTHCILASFALFPILRPCPLGSWYSTSLV